MIIIEPGLWVIQSGGRAASPVTPPTGTGGRTAGSGPGGGTMAWKLAQTGKRVLLVERGDYLKRERENWDTAIANYQKVISLSTDPSAKAEAYYYTGMGRWDQRQMDSAMDAFAKGAVQKDAPHAQHCRQYLETLYKSTHNGSLAGLEEFIIRVTR